MTAMPAHRASTQPDLSDEPPVRPTHPALAAGLAIVRVLVVAVVLAAVGYAVSREWDAVSEAIVLISPLTIALALLGAMVGLGATVKTWQLLLGALGSELHGAHAAQVFLTGQLARYLPGSVWAFLLQAQLGRRHEIPRARALLAVLLAVGVTTASGLTIGIVAVPTFAAEWGGWAWVLALGPLSLLCLVPRVLTMISNIVLRLLRRPGLTSAIDGRAILAALAWSVVSWFAYGLQLWALANSTGGLPSQEYPFVTATFALAVCAGFLAFLLPSGVGVREAVIAVGLSTFMPAGAALAIALVSRLVCTAADVLGAGCAVAISRLVHRRTAAVTRESSAAPRS